MAEDDESQQAADVHAGMLLKVLRSNPFGRQQSAIIGPGYYHEFPESTTLLISERDFNYYAEQMLVHNLRMNRIRTEPNGDVLYQLEEGNVIIPS